MNRKNKALALFAAISAIFCMVSCGGGDHSTPAVTTAVQSVSGTDPASSDSAAGDSTTPSLTSSGNVTSGRYTAEKTTYRTFQNNLVDLKVNYSLPELIGLPLHEGEQQRDKFISTASYFYGDKQTIRVRLKLNPVSADGMAKLTSKEDGFIKTNLDSSYETYLAKKENPDGTHTFCLECIAGAYLDGYRRFGVEIDPSNGGTDAIAEMICYTIAESLIMSGNDSGIFKENSFLFEKDIRAANTAVIAGAAATLEPTLKTDRLDAKCSFQADGLNYIASTAGIITKADYEALSGEYKDTTLAGKNAKLKAELTPDGQIQLTGQLLFSKENAMCVTLVTDSPNNQTQLTNPDALSAKLSEMMSEDNRDATVQALTAYLNDFCCAIRFYGVSETVPAVTLPTDASAQHTTMTTLTTTVFYHTTTTTETTTKAQQTTAAPRKTGITVHTTAEPSASKLPMDITNPFRHQSEISLSGKGYVFAKSGLRMRDKPSTSGNQVGTVKFGTTVSITALAVNGNSYGWNNNRWYRIKADGKTGYVSADYLAATFTQKPGDLSDRQLGAMVNFLYCQHHALFEEFALKGGFTGSTDSSDTLNDQYGEFAKVEPDTLTTDQLYDEFYQYFAKYYHRNELTQDLDSGNTVFYRTKGDNLYAACPYMEDSWIDYMIAESIQEISNSEILIHSQHFLKKHRASDPDAYITYEFSLYYEDGCWKAGKSDTIYSSFTRS